MKGYSRWFCALALFFLIATGAAPASAQTASTPAQPGCIITANPSSIIIGGSVTLQWQSSGATSGTISYIGQVDLNGSLNILPSSASQTIFTGTFIGPGGTATCQTIVTVSAGGGTSGSVGTSGSGSSYDSGSSYSVTPYSVNPSNDQTQPSTNQFSQTPSTVTSPQSSSGGVASFLVPCGLGSGAPSSDSSRINIEATSCDLCYFGQLIQNIINFLIIIAVPLSAGLFAWAGILYFTAVDDSGKIKRARKIFSSVVIGLIIALSGYLIVQTLMNALLNSQFSTGGWSWNSLQCSGSRPRSSTVGQIFTNLFLPSGTVTPTTSSTATGSGTTGSSGSGQPETITVMGADGQQHTVTFNATQPDVNLQSAYQTVAQNYGDQVNTACQSSSIPNCSQVVTSLIVAESGGNSATGCNNSNSCGLMQLTSANGGSACVPGDTTCISNQINKGVAYLNTQYSSFNQSVPNALAAYNGGPSTAPGSSPSGLNPAMANSVDCPGLYAWQCGTNPGGLTQTQGYVATICRLSQNNNGGC